MLKKKLKALQSSNYSFAAGGGEIDFPSHFLASFPVSPFPDNTTQVSFTLPEGFPSRNVKVCHALDAKPTPPALVWFCASRSSQLALTHMRAQRSPHSPAWAALKALSTCRWKDELCCIFLRNRSYLWEPCLGFNEAFCH